MDPLCITITQKLMSGTCHLQYRSKLGLPRVIAQRALECICADGIDGRKTQRSLIGDTVLLIFFPCYRKVDPPLPPPTVKNLFAEVLRVC